MALKLENPEYIGILFRLLVENCCSVRAEAEENLKS